MQLDSYLEIFTTMYGWAFANIIGEIITGTGLVILPFAVLIFQGWREAKEQGLTDQRLLVESGIIVKRVEALELYRVKDMSVAGTFLQTVFGRGQVILRSTDTTCPTLLINAVPNAVGVSELIRDTVEACRAAKGVRAFDY